jgi:hypothetical protein
MRLLPAVLLLVAPFTSVPAADIALVRVWPAWRTEESFRRISEYFDGKENTGNQIVLRTHADSRAGFYFLTRVSNSGTALGGAKFVLSIIAPDSAEPKVFAFPAAVPAGETVFQLGLTLPDWPGPKVHPVAWKLELAAPDGRVLAVQKSFLWEKPAK